MEYTVSRAPLIADFQKACSRAGVMRRRTRSTRRKRWGGFIMKIRIQSEDEGLEYDPGLRSVCTTDLHRTPMVFMQDQRAVFAPIGRKPDHPWHSIVARSGMACRSIRRFPANTLSRHRVEQLMPNAVYPCARPCRLTLRCPDFMVQDSGEELDTAWS